LTFILKFQIFSGRILTDMSPHSVALTAAFSEPIE